jgi:hypothetical protein
MMPMSTSTGSTRGGVAPTFTPTLPAMKFMFRNTALMISFFVAAVIISLSAPRTLLLQYVPNAYTSGGVVSWTGAAVLGAGAVVISQVINNFISGFF